MRILRLASIAVLAALATACGGKVYEPDSTGYSSETYDSSETSDESYDSTDWTSEEWSTGDDTTDWSSDSDDSSDWSSEWSDDSSSEWTSSEWNDDTSSDWSSSDWSDDSSSDWSTTEWSDDSSSDWSTSEWSSDSSEWSSGGQCVYFDVDSASQYCNSNSDCTWVVSGEVCQDECNCPDVPASLATAQYQQSVLASLGGDVFCGCALPPPPVCISHRCQP